MSTEAPSAFELPAALLLQGYRLRAETDGDIPFLRGLYATTRELELSVTNWSDDQKRAFCDSQFDAQRRHYRSYIPDCRFDVLVCGDEPIGRLYLEPRVTQLHIVDIALIPDWRGKGIGGAIVAALIDKAAQSGRGVGIFVEKFNPALRFYRRLGFTEMREEGPYFEMEWLPRQVS